MSLSQLGLCCEWIEPITKKSGKIEIKNMLDQRSLQLGRWQKGLYTEEMVRGVYIHNARSLLSNFERIVKMGIRAFRVSSAMFPLSDKVPREYWDNETIQSILKQVGEVAKRNGVRLSTHPGQFTVLSSDSDTVVDNAIRELAHHAWIFDAMELAESPLVAINVHGGKADRSQKLIDVIQTLPQNIKQRLTLENDESAYNVSQLLQVSSATGVPVVFDSHHHVFNDGGMSMEDAMNESRQTWRGIVPLQHLSNTEPELANGSFTDRRKHSNFIHYVPDCQLQAIRDKTAIVEVEAKMKNLSIFKMVKDFNLEISC